MEELDLQLGIDAKKAPEIFEEQKANLISYLDQAKKSVEELDLGDQAKGLQTWLDEMRVQMALGKAETKEAYEDQMTKLGSSLNSLSTEAKTLTEQANDKAKNWEQEFAHGLEKFQTQLDVMRVHFSLGMADANDEYETKKKELKTQLHELQAKAAKKGEEKEEKVEDFVEEMSEAFSHFKKGIRGLFS